MQPVNGPLTSRFPDPDPYPPKVIEEMTEKAMRKDTGAAGGRYSVM